MELHQKEDAALAFFRGMVEPTVAEFLAATQDKRTGCLACLMLSSMVEHYFYSQGGAPDDRDGLFALRNALRKENFAFRQVTDVANATKHVLRLDGRVGYEDVIVQDIQFGIYQCGWPLNGEETMVETKPGDFWLLRDLVEAATDMWRKKLIAYA